eukprot:CAMPEP_0181530960 /NCGR_PEP_ID=MMETSP1110-20121109/71864_1 /TAXON_ID=174948 /ORGANISM="Symbiodinium sp., Strain CCMP421" /LENGTH=93 /DNA_ID=CAMNT_0023662035 /DNA_START=115 /DNA_END=397 /DNA_ORIENTATION=+
MAVRIVGKVSKSGSPIVHAIKEEWQVAMYKVVTLHQKRIHHVAAGEGIPSRGENRDKNINLVLVEAVQANDRIPAVGLAPMGEDGRLQQPKLG